jgi:hypothetical protein
MLFKVEMTMTLGIQADDWMAVIATEQKLPGIKALVEKEEKRTSRSQEIRVMVFFEIAHVKVDMGDFQKSRRSLEHQALFEFTRGELELLLVSRFEFNAGPVIAFQLVANKDCRAGTPHEQRIHGLVGGKPLAEAFFVDVAYEPLVHLVTSTYVLYPAIEVTYNKLGADDFDTRAQT